MSTMSTEVISLMSSDKHVFQVERDVALMSKTINDLLEDTEDEQIPVSNVDGKTLARVIEFAKHEAALKARAEARASRPASDADKEEEKKDEEDRKKFEESYANDLKNDQSALFDVILASNYLNIKSLLDLTCKTVAGMIKGKSPEEIRQQFNIKNDFTPEEEEEVRKENQWAFD